MSRPLRIKFLGAFYHVTSRGDRQKAIYEDDDDREALLGVLGKFVERMQSKLGDERDERDDVQIPKLKRRERAPALAELAERAPNRDAAIVAAHATAANTYMEIGAFFGLNFATIGKIVRKASQTKRRGKT